MANESKYVVKVKVSYVYLEFEFTSLMGAGNFMDMFLDHCVRDEDDVEVCMVRVDPVREDEEEEAE